MKTKLYIMILIGVIGVLSSISSYAQTTTAHCYAAVQIVDPNYNGTSDYYYVSIRLETNYPSVSSWCTPIGPVYSLSPVSFSNIIFTNIPYPNPVSKDYYSIGALVSKNGGTPLYYNSSVAAATVINDGNTQFDPISNPIEVKIP